MRSRRSASPTSASTPSKARADPPQDAPSAPVSQARRGAAFPGDKPMNPYLDEDLVTLGDHVRRFATDRIAPGFQERDRTRVLERQLMREMGEMGFIAPELPEKFGGQGLGCLAAGVIHEEIARADLSISYINLLASLNCADPVGARPARSRRAVAREAGGRRGAVRDRADRAARRLGRRQPAAEGRARRRRLRDQRREDLDLGRRPGRHHGGLRPHRHGRIGGARRDRAAGADGHCPASPPAASTATASAPSAAARSSSRTCACPSTTASATRTRASCR